MRLSEASPTYGIERRRHTELSTAKSDQPFCLWFERRAALELPAEWSTFASFPVQKRASDIELTSDGGPFQPSTAISAKRGHLRRIK